MGYSLEKTNGIGPTNSPIPRLSPLWQHSPLRVLSSSAVSCKCLGDPAENHSFLATLFSLLSEKSGFVLFLSGFDLFLSGFDLFLSGFDLCTTRKICIKKQEVGS